MKKIKIEKMVNFFSRNPSFVFDQKLIIAFFLEMNSLHKLHYHIFYEEVYQYKRFQNFNIKIVTRIACSNFKNKQKTSLGTLGIKV